MISLACQRPRQCGWFDSPLALEVERGLPRSECSAGRSVVSDQEPGAGYGAGSHLTLLIP